MHLPKITCCVRTYNEEKRIAECLRGIFGQNYPRQLLEVILVDDISTDKTIAIAENFPVKILINETGNAEISLIRGFKESTGTFFTVVDADMFFRGKNWFQKMLKPLLENPDISAAFTGYYSHKRNSLITKYLNLDSIQRDLVYQIFSPGFNEVINEKKNGYYVCQYSVNKIPPQVHGLYRSSILKKILVNEIDYHDMIKLVILVDKGYKKFAYVPQAGYYHFHVDSLLHLGKKRIRNIKERYLDFYTNKNHYKWFDASDSARIKRTFFLILATYLILPLCLFSLSRALIRRNLLYLLEPAVTFVIVSAILYAFLSDKRGRKFIILQFAKIVHLPKGKS
ncbi:MAG: hypothetical protein A3B53_02290 [Candidatus Levybacteria bacterium RIFCSPLOWO2_01_FULL_42_15]|nr:MAG: hypothetical protein A3B53_02290 [Candidatus Levybacteria bacterium RIFCSPLOWO2_01_FULL_42_15]